MWFSLCNSWGSRSDTGPEVSTLLADGASDGRTLHFTLRVDDDTSVVFEVNEDTILSSPGFALTDNNGGGNLLSQFRFSLLDGSHDHVSDTGGRQAVQTTTNTAHGKDVQVLGTSVVSAVHDSGNGQSQCLSELVACSSSSSSLTHD